MLDSSLQFPYLPRWRDDPDYSETVSTTLVSAYALLKGKASRLAGYLQAFNLLTPYVAGAMSRRQRMHVHYVLGSALMAAAETAAARENFAVALEIALIDLHDVKAAAELSYLHAMATSWLLRYADAAGDLQTCLDLLAHVPPDERTLAAEQFKISALATMASFEFMAARYPLAIDRLDAARMHLTTTPDSELGRATVEWVWALLYRWRGEPERALKSALIAAELYSQADMPASYARIQSIVAEIALDLAYFYPSGIARNSFLTLAAPYARRSRNLARKAHDEAGEDLAELASIRLSRLQHRGDDRVARLEGVIRRARRTKDGTLLSPAYTELGRELASRGRDAAARNCYEAALDSLHGHQAPAMGIWAQRALLER